MSDPGAIWAPKRKEKEAKGLVLGHHQVVTAVCVCVGGGMFVGAARQLEEKGEAEKRKTDHRWPRSEQSLTNQRRVRGAREDPKKKGRAREKHKQGKAIKDDNGRCTESPQLEACTSSNLCMSHY